MLRVTIAGVEHADDIGAMSMEFQLNERAHATLHCGPGYIPGDRVPVVAYAKNGTTPIFGGVTLNRRVGGLAEHTLEDVTEVDIVDWWAYTDWAVITLSYDSAVDLNVVLVVIAAELAVYGISYTSAATGILVAPFSWVDKRISDGLRELFTRIGAQRVFRFTPTGVLQVVTPGAVAAPFTITDAAPHCSVLSWQDSPEIPANRVIVRCGPTGTALATQRWLADGVATSWVTDIPAAGRPALVQVDPPAAPAYLATVGAPGDAAAMFLFDVATSTLSLGTAATPVSGTTLVLGPKVAAGDPFETDGYLAIYPFRVVRPATPPAVPVTLVLERADLVEYGPAVEYADGILAQLDEGRPRELEVHTVDDGFEEGQLLTVNVTTMRGTIVGTFLITRRSITLVRSGQADEDPADDYWEYVIAATKTTLYRGSELEEWRRLGGGGGGAVTLAGGAGTPAAPAVMSPAFLGGSDRFRIPAAAAASWVDVYNVVPYEADQSFTALVRVELWAADAGVGVTARLWNQADGVEVLSSEVVSQARTFVSITAAVLTGKTYRLQVRATTGSGAVSANAGTLRRVA